MPISKNKRSILFATAATGTVAAVLAATFAPAQGTEASQASQAAEQGRRHHRVILSGLDNPRQLSLTPGGALLIAEAGHGANNPDNCVGRGENATCIGRTGHVTKHRIGGPTKVVMRGLLSMAGRDGTFAVGADGASKRPGGAYFAIITSAPPDIAPQGVPGWQSGKLLANKHNGGKRVVANIARFEARHDVDGEGVESNPYSVLALKKKVLVADAAGDYIAQVRHGRVSVWATMPEYGRRVDAVPTVLSLGHDGFVYVGELHSELRGKAKVWKYDRQGNPVRAWHKFTTVTGVARGKNGALYVSELFGGNCGFDQIPSCFPGRVVKVAPNGERTYRRVPFPAGVAVKNGKVFVNAFSIAPSTGAMGIPNTSGQLWRVFF